LWKDSTATKDEGTTVDTTTIQFHFDPTPVVCFEVTVSSFVDSHIDVEKWSAE